MVALNCTKCYSSRHIQERMLNQFTRRSFKLAFKCITFNRKHKWLMGSDVTNRNTTIIYVHTLRYARNAPILNIGHSIIYYHHYCNIFLSPLCTTYQRTLSHVDDVKCTRVILMTLLMWAINGRLECLCDTQEP